MWKAVNAEYKATLTRFVMSGTHESSFFDFCNGNLATYYLRKHLDAKPQLNETVEADLPAECGLSSELPFPDELAKNSASSMASKITNSDGNRRKKGSPNEVADAIREFNNSLMRSEIAKQKLNNMSNEETRRASEEGPNRPHWIP